ncbi:6524_t:CDS:1, partial [Funneliformis caledonium]
MVIDIPFLVARCIHYLPESSLTILNHRIYIDSTSDDLKIRY